MGFFVFSGLLFPFLMTALGAAVVFLFRQRIGARAQRVCLGFAAGVMAAATAFSLLVPAAEQIGAAGGRAWPVLTAGFLLGAGAIAALDSLLRRAGSARGGGRELLLWAVTLHNIPEGMAVGLPLRQSGMTRRRSFAYGALSGAVEPLAAALVLLAAGWLAPVLPALMALAAGAMMLVVFGELIPASAGRRDGAAAAIAGFALMMALDMMWM